jgi:hypothetical protein
MTARIIAVFGPGVRYHLALLHCWQLALAVFWMTGGAA